MPLVVLLSITMVISNGNTLKVADDFWIAIAFIEKIRCYLLVWCSKEWGKKYFGDLLRALKEQNKTQSKSLVTNCPDLTLKGSGQPVTNNLLPGLFPLLRCFSHTKPLP